MPACVQERGGLHMQKQGERIRNGTSASALRRVFGRRRIEEGSVRRKSGAARSFNVVSFPRKRESRAPARGQVWMPAFAGMTLTFLSHPPISNDSRDQASPQGRRGQTGIGSARLTGGRRPFHFEPPRSGSAAAAEAFVPRDQIASKLVSNFATIA